MPEIVLVPTSHVARQSLENVRKAIETEKPGCVAVELDMNRYAYLKQGGEQSPFYMLKILGPPTFAIYWVLKKFQDHFGKKTGILPGSEMAGAVDLARERGITVALIDQPIEVTLLRIKSLSLQEKLGLFRLLLLGLLGLALPSGGEKKMDLNKVPQKRIIDQAMDHLKRELPGFYRVLVEERNRFMSRNLGELSKKFDKIVCVIGAGHEKGIKKLLR